MEGGIGVPSHDDGVFSHVRRQEAPPARNLALVSNVKPASGKDVLQFLFVDSLRTEGFPAQRTRFGIEHAPRILSHRHAFHSPRVGSPPIPEAPILVRRRPVTGGCFGPRLEKIALEKDTEVLGRQHNVVQ